MVSSADHHRRGVASTLSAIAVLAAQQRQYGEAATLSAAATAVVDTDLDPAPSTADAKRLQAVLVAALGVEQYGEHARRGRGSPSTRLCGSAWTWPLERPTMNRLRTPPRIGR
ncbi:MAG: hypothetical protein WKF82_10010 [Nocardioidaceae bacterium]